MGLSILDDIKSNVSDLRYLLAQFEQEQNEDSDEGNLLHIAEAELALDAFEGHINNIVP